MAVFPCACIRAPRTGLARRSRPDRLVLSIMVACRSCSRNRDAIRVSRSATGGRARTRARVDVCDVVRMPSEV